MLIENTGSTARDVCMLERNLLATLKLATLLCLLFSSVLLRGRLTIEDEPEKERGHPVPNAGVPMATLQFLAALFVVGGGIYEYHSGVRDLRCNRAFLRSDKPRFVVMSVVGGVVVATCLLLLIDNDAL